MSLTLNSSVTVLDNRWSQAPATHPGRFPNEQARSKREYPPGYAPRGIAEQVKILSGHFRGLSVESTYAYIENALPTFDLALTEGAEGWFAIVRWEKLARVYGEASEVILAKLGELQRLRNYWCRQLIPRWFRQSKRTTDMFCRATADQTGDVLVIPAQFGFFHRSQSVLDARDRFSKIEYGLGVVAGASMLLTHAEREWCWEQLHTDLPGDEFSADGDGQFSTGLSFYSYDSIPRFGIRDVSEQNDDYGSASGFVPQPKAT